MSQKYENKYQNLKNYELESMFELSKKQKEQLSSNIEPKTRHNLKLQEFYLKVKVTDFPLFESEVLAYIKANDYLLEKEQIGKFYEVIAFAAANVSAEKQLMYVNKAIENFPTTYCLEIAIYNALSRQNIYLAARLILIAIEADLQFDSQLSYYNLVVEHYFEEDIKEYYKLMDAFQDEYISVDNITIEFSFNKLIANYYIHKYVDQSADTEVLRAKKTINEQLLKAISSMKDESELRSEVLRVRNALATIDTNQDVDIFSLISFSLLPKPKGVPDASPFNKIK